MSKDLRRKIIYSLILALILYIVLALWSDWQQLTAALIDFPWSSMWIVVALAGVNIVGRLLKWQWYLRLLEVPISRWDSTRVFGVGMLMVMTPGKAGEFLKSYMVKNVTGTPMSITLPVPLAERMTDGMAMILLASVGLYAFSFPYAQTIATVLFSGFVIFIVITQIRPVALKFLEIGERLPLIKFFAGNLHTFYESSYVIFRPLNLLIALVVGAITWGAVSVAYYIVLLGFGATPGFDTLLIAVFIFCISTVVGAVVAMPGGLGGMEGSMVALSVSLLGMTVPAATAAALLTRFATLWITVIIGVVSFLLWPNLLAGSENVSRDGDESDIDEETLPREAQVVERGA